MYIAPRQRKGLGGIFDTIGTVIGVAAQERAGSRAAHGQALDAQARIAEAQANVEAARLALQAEALKSKQPKGISTPIILVGVAALLGVGGFFFLRRKGRK